jgi:hypothetical protein
MHRNTRASWHDQPISILTAQLQTDVQHGLTPAEAAQRLHTTWKVSCNPLNLQKKFAE